MADESEEYTVLIPGPSFHIDLSALDARHPVHYSRHLLIFHCASAAQRDAQLAAFKAGVQALVLRCPILGGVVVPLPPDITTEDLKDWRTIVPGRGLELIVRDLRVVMPSFEELETTGFPLWSLPYDLLMPVPKGLGNDRPFAACKMQFSTIKGGTILTFAMSHTVADGRGMDELIRVLIEQTRLAQEHPQTGVANKKSSEAAPAGMGTDRSVLRNMTSNLVFNIAHHPAYQLQSPSPPDAPPPPPDQAPPHPFKATSPETPVLLRISASSLAQLKADATTPGAPLISTHDALSALMWRTALLIRSRRSPPVQTPPPSTTTHVFMPSDARRHLGLPPSYVGNAVYQLAAALDLGTLLSPVGLQRAASALRRAITAVTPALVASYMSYTNAATDATALEWRFLGLWDTTALAMGTCLGSGDVLYGGDWGRAFGPVASFRLVGEAINCVMPRLPDGGAEVVVSVMPDEVEVLKGVEGFGRYMETR